MKNLVWETNVRKTKTMLKFFNKKLQAFMKFNNCEGIQIDDKLNNTDVIEKK